MSSCPQQKAWDYPGFLLDRADRKSGALIRLGTDVSHYRITLVEQMLTQDGGQPFAIAGFQRLDHFFMFLDRTVPFRFLEVGLEAQRLQTSVNRQVGLTQD